MSAKLFSLLLYSSNACIYFLQLLCEVVVLEEVHQLEVTYFLLVEDLLALMG